MQWLRQWLRQCPARAPYFCAVEPILARVEFLSTKAASYVVDAYGRAGSAWVGAADVLVRATARAWGVVDLEPLGGAGRSAVAVGRRSGLRVVLKAEPDVAVGMTAAGALDHWAKVGAAPPILELDPTTGCYLMGWAGGHPLASRADHGVSATTHLAELLGASALRGSPLVARPSFLEDRLAQASARAMKAAHPLLSPDRMDVLADTALGLATADPSQTVIHGDLTPYNVFGPEDRSRGPLLLIDPEPASPAPLSFDLSYWAFRLGLGVQFDAHARVAAVAGGADPDLVAGWGPVHAATYSLYLLAFGRAPSPVMLSLAGGRRG